MSNKDFIAKVLSFFEHALYFHEGKDTGQSYHTCDIAVWPVTVYTPVRISITTQWIKYCNTSNRTCKGRLPSNDSIHAYKRLSCYS